MAAADLIEKKGLSLAAARRVADAAAAEAAKSNLKMTIAVVDEGGHLLYFVRPDIAPASIDNAIGKARSAALFNRATKSWEDVLAGGRNAVLAIPGAVPVGGGVPIQVDGKAIGAIGASGASSEIDDRIAQAGAAALGA